MAFDFSIVGKPSSAHKFSYTWKDAALYALGVGAKRDELDWLYEGRGPKVLPSFVVVPMFRPMSERMAQTGGDPAMVVHGKQSIRLYGQLPPEGTLNSVAVVRGIYDMRKFAIVVIDCEIRNEAGDRLAETSSQIIVRGAGNFGGELPPKEEKVADVPRDRAPDFSIEEATSPEQALLYRLSGDLNPLHADPAFAARVGFAEGPILHGLCTFGHMVRHVAQGACGGDPSRIVAFETRFSKPVWPGDTLVTDGWKVGSGKVALVGRVRGKADPVCTSSWAITRDDGAHS